MGLMCKGVLALVIFILAYGYHLWNKVPEAPYLEDTWWGPGSPSKVDETIRPFKIDVPKNVIDDLNQRLENAIPFHPPLEGVAQNYGMNTNLLKTIVDYWKTKYNWNERQTFLNKYPQFKTNIQGLNIHFIHVKPQNLQGVNVFPILLAHGWPGSIREFYEIIPLLTTKQPGRNFVFEVIIPSLPGYGFSDGAVRPGLAVAQMAHIFKNLMLRLGFDRFYVQGGDWGSLITQDMAAFYPEHVIGVHGNSCFRNDRKSQIKYLISTLVPSLLLTDIEKERSLPFFDKYLNFFILEGGYMHLHATKPDTVGIALRDSPVGLAAYIIEKFTSWTKPAWKDLDDGGLSKKWTMEKLLDNVMIYWVTRSITTSVRLYAEVLNPNNLAANYEEVPIDVPSACARFPHEIGYPPIVTLTDKFRNLIHVSDHEDGGHFAAFELPEVLAKDIYDFVEKVIKLPKKDQEEL